MTTQDQYRGKSLVETMGPICRKLVKFAGDPHFINSSSLVGTRAIAGSVRIGILLGIARAYGPAKFGQLSLVISMVEILRTFSEFGVDTISIRRFAQTPPEERAELLGGIIGAKLLMASCFYCIGAAVLLTITREPVELELGAITGLSLFFSGALGGITSYLLSFFSISRVFRTTLLTSVLSGCFVLIAILSKASLLWVIVGLPLADALNLLLLSQKLDTHLRVRFRVRETISLLKESLPVGIAVTSVILYFRLDNLFLFKFAGAAALGLYAVCYRIVEPALLIPNSFSTTSYTLLSRTEYQHAGARRLMRILIRTMCPAYAFTATAAAFFLLLGKPLVTRFFPGYPAAYPVLLVLVLTLSVRTVNATLVAVLNSRAKYSLLAKITVINLAVNLLLVIALVPKWGPLGAAWAALLTEVLNGLMQGKNVISILLPTNCPQLAQSIRVE